MADVKRKITELASLMDEYGLDAAELRGDGWRVAFRRPVIHEEPTSASSQPLLVERSPEPVYEGTPISSPMAGIFYLSPTPADPPYVKVGDTVGVGQAVGVIEAMKVFNEIQSHLGGTVTAVVVESGQLVQPGEPLIYVQ